MSGAASRRSPAVDGEATLDLDDVNEFIARSRRLSDPEALQRLLSETSRSLGFDHFALIHHVNLSRYDPSLSHMRSGGLIAVLDYPETWVEAYRDRNLAASDPVIIASNRTNVGFRWDEIPKLVRRRDTGRTLEKNSRIAGFGNGFTVPAHVPGETNGSCNFVMRAGRELPNAALPAAQLVGAFAFQAARRIVARSTDHRDPPRPLTARQLDCLVLVGRGRNENQIATALGISAETVKRHLKDARVSRDADKTVQVLMRALFDGELSLADVMLNNASSAFGASGYLAPYSGSRH